MLMINFILQGAMEGTREKRNLQSAVPSQYPGRITTDQDECDEGKFSYPEDRLKILSYMSMLMTNFLYETRLQGIMGVVFNKIYISKTWQR